MTGVTAQLSSYTCKYSLARKVQSRDRRPAGHDGLGRDRIWNLESGIWNLESGIWLETFVVFLTPHVVDL